jgi:LacI family gluconate utilization system Gnt-I transcriptional repressor
MLLGETGDDVGLEQQLIATMLGRRAERLILVGSSQSDAAHRLLRMARVPVVQTWDLVDDPIDRLVGFSHFEAERAIAEHLVSRG